jgi:hypothetical protein
MASTYSNASGSAPVYACRARVNFNGTGTPAIRGSGNISSVSRTSTGRFTINFTTAMPDVNYGISQVNSRSTIGGSGAIGFLTTSNPTTTQMFFGYGTSSANEDPLFAGISVFRQGHPMNQVIIYNQDNGIPAIVMPTQEALDQHGIMAIAIKDVPHNHPFKIIDADQLPQGVVQEAWRIDDALLTDGVGGVSSEFPPQIAG